MRDCSAEAERPSLSDCDDGDNRARGGVEARESGEAAGDNDESGDGDKAGECGGDEGGEAAAGGIDGCCPSDKVIGDNGGVDGCCPSDKIIGDNGGVDGCCPGDKENDGGVDGCCPSDTATADDCGGDEEGEAAAAGGILANSSTAWSMLIAGRDGPLSAPDSCYIHRQRR